MVIAWTRPPALSLVKPSVVGDLVNMHRPPLPRIDRFLAVGGGSSWPDQPRSNRIETGGRDRGKRGGRNRRRNGRSWSPGKKNPSGAEKMADEDMSTGRAPIETSHTDIFPQVSKQLGKPMGRATTPGSTAAMLL